MNLVQRIKEANGLEKIKLLKEFGELGGLTKIKMLKEFKETKGTGNEQEASRDNNSFPREVEEADIQSSFWGNVLNQSFKKGAMGLTDEDEIITDRYKEAKKNFKYYFALIQSLNKKHKNKLDAYYKKTDRADRMAKVARVREASDLLYEEYLLKHNLNKEPNTEIDTETLETIRDVLNNPNATHDDYKALEDDIDTIAERETELKDNILYQEVITLLEELTEDSIVVDSIDDGLFEQFGDILDTNTMDNTPSKEGGDA